MSIGIVENLGKSFDFAKTRLVGNWLDWIILIVLLIIPIIGWLVFAGFIVRVYRGGEAKLGDWIKMLIDGILLAIIGIVYMIAPIIVAFIFGGAAVLASVNPMNPAESLTALSTGIGIVGILVTLIVAIIFGIMATMASVRFAKEQSLGAAFQFGDIFGIIGKIGWIHYILSWIVLAIILGVIIGILFIIPVLGMILLLILAPLFGIWEARFFANLYESA